MKHNASCCCGQLTLTYDGELPSSSICHCFACQQRTGSVFGSQAGFDRTKVTTLGDFTKYVRTGDSGGTATFHFCPKCGSTVFWRVSGMPEKVIIAVGAFANSEFPAPTFSVYEDRQHPWVELPESVTVHWD